MSIEKLSEYLDTLKNYDLRRSGQKHTPKTSLQFIEDIKFFIEEVEGNLEKEEPSSSPQLWRERKLQIEILRVALKKIFIFFINDTLLVIDDTLLMDACNTILNSKPSKSLWPFSSYNYFVPRLTGIVTRASCNNNRSFTYLENIQRLKEAAARSSEHRCSEEELQRMLEKVLGNTPVDIKQILAKLKNTTVENISSHELIILVLSIAKQDYQKQQSAIVQQITQIEDRIEKRSQEQSQAIGQLDTILLETLNTLQKQSQVYQLMRQKNPKLALECEQQVNFSHTHVVEEYLNAKGASASEFFKSRRKSDGDFSQSSSTTASPAVDRAYAPIKAPKF